MTGLQGPIDRETPKGYRLQAESALPFPFEGRVIVKADKLLGTPHGETRRDSSVIMEITMKPRLIPPLLVLARLAAWSFSPGWKTGSGAGEELTDFLSFLAAYTTAWNTHAGSDLANLFTQDADMILGNQPCISGRDAIGRWWNAYFSRIDDGRKGEFDLVSVNEIAPGVRLANVVSKTYGENKHGDALEPRFARGTWVVVKRTGGWLIAGMRGQPVEGEFRAGPGTDL